jgi:hypothetical protein
MAKYRDHPTGEWPFYPTLEEGDIEHEYWTTKKMIHQAFINDRKGRIVVLMHYPKYKAFLDEIKKRKGNMWSVTIEEVMQEAIDLWMEQEE